MLKNIMRDIFGAECRILLKMGTIQQAINSIIAITVDVFLLKLKILPYMILVYHEVMFS